MSEHPVQVDHEGARAAFEQYAGQPEGESLENTDASPGEAEGDDGEGWQGTADFLASFLAHKVTPAWEVPGDVQQEWAAVLAECANQLFPGGVGNIDNWSPWAKLAWASGAWALCGFDMDRFVFVSPLEKQPTSADTPEDETADPEAMHYPDNSQGGTFTTMT